MKCIDAFKNLNVEIRDNNLNISPCCLSKTAKVDSINFNDEHLTNIRKIWLNKQFPDECSNCQQAEQHNLSSRRIGSNQWYKDHGYDNLDTELIRLDYWTGDICNLACVICGPHNSSLWKQELGFAKEDKKQVTNKFWKTIDISRLKFIHFNGGEPLLSKEHIEFLQSIPEKSQVHLNYNTNGTILPTAELLDLWSQYKLVQLDFSIDDIGTRYEYQRYPAKWESVESNLKWFIDNSPVNCMFAVNTTVSILNQANLENLNSWLKTNFHSNRVTDPIEHRQQLAFGLFALESAETRKAKIIEFLNNCDARRGTSWPDVFPELANFINT
jgi:sulfatase maturation enzyme AslB (radical SAM superfamily)